MRLLRRSTDTPTVDEPAAAQGPADPARTGGKGRPTPKRREAEAKRRGPAPPPPRNQREAARLARANRPDKTEQRKQSAVRRERMAAGDDKYLMPRDRGPVKAYIRDVVDSRPHLMGLFMPLAVIVVLSVVVPAPSIQRYLTLFSTLMLAVLVVEGLILGIQITRRTRVKFPDQRVPAVGTSFYAFSRAMQLRRLRIPKPRVKRGATV